VAEDAYGRALKLLGQRAHLRAELRRKLLRKGFEAEEVEAALDRCAAAGYLDDEATARSLARQGQARRGWGSVRVRAELQRRGAGAETVAAALASSSAEDEAARAREAAARWLRTHPLRGREDRARLARHLERKGFPARAVRAALDAAGGTDPAGAGEIEAEPAD
jgi:regulatory protein